MSKPTRQQIINKHLRQHFGDHADEIKKLIQMKEVSVYIARGAVKLNIPKVLEPILREMQLDAQLSRQIAKEQRAAQA